MNLKTKKIIAREFLLLILSLGIAFLIFLFVFPYNYFQEGRINDLNKKVSLKAALADNLSKPIDNKLKKQQWFADNYLNTFDAADEYGIKPSYKKIWERLDKIAKADSIKYKWENSWKKNLVPFNKKMGFETPEDFKVFILNNIVHTSDIAAKTQADSIIKELDNLYHKKKGLMAMKISYDKQVEITVLTFLLSLIILFAFRYILLGVRWSIKTLKQNSD